MPAHENDRPPAAKRPPEANPSVGLPPPPWPRERSLYGVPVRRLPWGWALLVGLLCATVAAVVAWFAIPVTYTATAWLRIAARPPRVAFDVARADDFLTHRSTQAALVTSTFVLEAALRKPGIAELPCIRQQRDPVTWMKNAARVSFPGDGEIMQVAMTGKDPTQLAKLVDAVKDAYLDQVVAAQYEDGLRQKQVVEEGYQHALKEVENKADQFDELADQLGLADSEADGIEELLSLEILSELRSRVNRIRDEIARCDRRVTVLKTRLAKTGTASEAGMQEESLVQLRIEAILAQDPWFAQANAQLASLESAILEEKLRAGQEDAPSVLRLQERLDTVKAGLARRREELLPQVVQQVRLELARAGALPASTMSDQVLALIEDTEFERTLLEEELQTAVEAFEDAAKQAEQSSTFSAELQTRQDELERLKRIAQELGDRAEEWEIELAAEPRVTLLEAASVPKSSNIDVKLRNLALIVVAAFLAGGGAVLAIGFLIRQRDA